ncbi:MAG: acylphosphatase [Candidatus Cloacimonadales bacterium]|nr:acylphosphatase [Candidatus Cloacimonadales bacterium]
MKRVTLHIAGKVQQVGFRSKAVAIANVLGIKGNVQNLVDGTVKIVAEGEEADLERFIKCINIQNTLIYITNIVKDYSTPTGDYESFYKLVGEGETDERLDTAADLLKELIHVTKNGFGRLENKQDIMIEKQDVMIEKQDVMIEKQDVMIEKQTETMDKIDRNRIEIVSEIRSSRDDFKSHVDVRISMIEQDLAQIKAKVMI